MTAATADRAYLVAGHSVPVRSCNLPQRLQHRSQRPRPRLQPLTALQHRSQRPRPRLQPLTALQHRSQRPRPRLQPLTALQHRSQRPRPRLQPLTALQHRSQRPRPRLQPLTALQRRSQLRSRCQRPRSRPGDGGNGGDRAYLVAGRSRSRPQLQPPTAPTAPVTASTSAAVTSHSPTAPVEAGVSAHGVDLDGGNGGDRAYQVAGHSVEAGHVRGCNLSQRLQHRSQRPRPQLQPPTALQRRLKPVSVPTESTWTAATAGIGRTRLPVTASKPVTSAAATSHSAYSAGRSRCQRPGSRPGRLQCRIGRTWLPVSASTSAAATSHSAYSVQVDSLDGGGRQRTGNKQATQNACETRCFTAILLCIPSDKVQPRTSVLDRLLTSAITRCHTSCSQKLLLTSVLLSCILSVQ